MLGNCFYFEAAGSKIHLLTMDVFRIQIVDPRAMHILRTLEKRGWILIEAIDDGDEMFKDADLFVNEKRMTDEEFESFAADILAR